MSRSQAKIIVVLILIGLAFLVYQYMESDDGLTISLRCDDGISGTLSVSNIEQNPNAKQIEEHFDVQEACTAETDIKFTSYPYPDGGDIKLVYKNAAGEATHLIAKRGDDIFVSGGVRYVVLISLTKTSPFIEIDSI